MSSMEEMHNIIFVLVTAAQDSVIEYSKSRGDISLWFDLLLTKWPIWRMLDRLSCKSSMQSCVVRSGIKCYLPSIRQYVNCAEYYAAPAYKPNYALCGEHDVCTLMNVTNNLGFGYYDSVQCVDWHVCCPLFVKTCALPQTLCNFREIFRRVAGRGRVLSRHSVGGGREGGMGRRSRQFMEFVAHVHKVLWNLLGEICRVGGEGRWWP